MINVNHWLYFNPGASYLGMRRGWPTFRLRNDIFVVVTKTERNIVGQANFEVALAATPCRKISLVIATAWWCDHDPYAMTKWIAAGMPVSKTTFEKEPNGRDLRPR